MCFLSCLKVLQNLSVLKQHAFLLPVLRIPPARKAGSLLLVLCQCSLRPQLIYCYGDFIDHSSTPLHKALDKLCPPRQPAYPPTLGSAQQCYEIDNIESLHLSLLPTETRCSPLSYGSTLLKANTCQHHHGAKNSQIICRLPVSS